MKLSLWHTVGAGNNFLNSFALMYQGFAELEYGMLRFMGAIDDSTAVVTTGKWVVFAANPPVSSVWYRAYSRRLNLSLLACLFRRSFDQEAWKVCIWIWLLFEHLWFSSVFKTLLGYIVSIHWITVNQFAQLWLTFVFALDVTCEISCSARQSIGRWYSDWKAINPRCTCWHHLHSNAGHFYQHINSKASRLVNLCNMLHFFFYIPGKLISWTYHGIVLLYYHMSIFQYCIRFFIPILLRL